MRNRWFGRDCDGHDEVEIEIELKNKHPGGTRLPRRGERGWKERGHQRDCISQNNDERIWKREVKTDTRSLPSLGLVPLIQKMFG